MTPITKPDKKVPTHGPGTTAWYRGKEAKILAIKNGKAKIFCDGQVLLVNYTSLDDAAFKTSHEDVNTGMAFGIGSTVSFNGKKCKIVSISNGVCKLVCGSEVMTANMKDLQPLKPINEGLKNTAFTSFYGTLQKANNQLPTDIFEVFAKNYFLADRFSILNEMVDNVLTCVGNLPINQFAELSKKFLEGRIHDKIQKFIYLTNSLNYCRTDEPKFDQSFWNSCLALLVALGRRGLNKVIADSFLILYNKKTVSFVDLPTSDIEAISNVVSKLPYCKISRKTDRRIEVTL